MMEPPNPEGVDVGRVLGDFEDRDLNREGIPMFLVLDGTGPETSPDGRLGRLAGEYLGRIAADPAHITPTDLATTLEVLAACHFDPFSGGGPVNESVAFEGLTSGMLVRAINYHNTPRAQASRYERQLMTAGERCRAAGGDDLDGLLSGRPWLHPEPPVLPVFYEGYRNNYDVALPMLERAGLRGWFFIPTAFIDTPVSEQRDFALSHEIGLTDDEHGDGRYAMTWDELRDVVARGHVVACHTATHCAAASISGPEDVRREITDSKARLEDELGCEVPTLAWLLGTPHGERPMVDDAVREAGYRTVFSNTKIQRIPG